MDKLDRIAIEPSSITTFIQKTMDWYVEFANDYTLPMTYAAEFARNNIKKIFKNESSEYQEISRKLETALPHNITIEMGIEMFKLSQFNEINQCSNSKEFKAIISSGNVSSLFKDALNDFIEKFGFRCAMELDIATPRPSEDISTLFDQFKSMSALKNQNDNPIKLQERGRKTREESFETLYEYLSAKSKKNARKFKSSYEVLVELGGYREIHKYYLIKIVAMTRTRILEMAQNFVDEKRLESADQIFSLKFKDLDSAMKNIQIDLIALSEERSAFYKKIKKIDNFPSVIDSRGKILMPPKRKAKEGELAGEAISLGKVKGKVKVLNTPDEKILNPGEILVARATDPGWTPLFINASGVILEVGGLFQHGALVAREYGKPCVAGIENATQRLKDDMIVEIDGANGIVKIIKKVGIKIE